MNSNNAINNGDKFNNNDANKCKFGAMVDSVKEQVSGPMGDVKQDLIWHRSGETS